MVKKKKRRTAIGQGIIRGERRDPTTGGTGHKPTKQKYSIGGKELSRKDYKAAKSLLGFRGGSGGKVSKKAQDVATEYQKKEKKIIEERKKEANKKVKESREPGDVLIPATRRPKAGEKTRDVGYEQLPVEAMGSGEVSPVTAGDVLAATGIAGTAKGAITTIGRGVEKKLASEATKKAIKEGMRQQDTIEAALKGISPENIVQTKKWATKTLNFVMKNKKLIGWASGANFLGVWLGSDNVAFQSGKAIKMAKERLESDPSYTKEQAINDIELAEGTLKLATYVIKASAKVNPALWMGGGHLWSMQAELAMKNFETEKDWINRNY